MPNPFTWYPRPVTAKEHQSNANRATYQKQEAIEALQEYDEAGIKAPCDVISAVHTMRWVEKGLIRKAQQVRAEEALAAKLISAPNSTLAFTGL
jgi:hypothetical protein